MKSYLRFTLIFLFTLGIFLFQSLDVFAGLEHNIRGEAYIEQEDYYIYFNCLDEPDGSFTFFFPFPLGGDPCQFEHQGIDNDKISNYGVHLNYDTFVFEGHALHERYKIISFEDGPKDNNYDFLDSCPYADQTGCDEVNCSACYNVYEQKVYGWAYVINDDDWIELNSNEVVESDRMSIFNYKSVNRAGDFFGKFYYDNWGNVDLNCEVPTPSYCSPEDEDYYKVYSSHVNLAKMSAPNWGENQACNIDALGAVLRWSIHSGNISGFDIRVNSEPCGDLSTCFDESESSKISLDSNDLGFNSSQFNLGDNFNLDYDTSYYWWLRLRDDSEHTPTSTDWIQFDHGSEIVDGVYGELTHNEQHNLNNSSKPDLTFTTYKHDWPQPYFSWVNYPNVNFLAGLANRFYVSDETHYFDASNNQVLFNDPSFVDDFLWWGQPDDEITILNAYDLPDINNLLLHLEADSITDINDDGRVNNWEDLSGNGYHFTASEDKSPYFMINKLNGRPVLEAREGEWLRNEDIPIGSDNTIFIVWSIYNESSEAWPYAFDSYNSSFKTYLAHNNNEIILNTGTDLSYSKSKPFDYQINSMVTGEEGRIYENGDLKISGDTGNDEGFGLTLFGRYNTPRLYGAIAEVIIYNRDLTNSEREEVESYLAKKWGMESVIERTKDKVDVYFESNIENQEIWLRLTDPTEYTCATSSPFLNVNYKMPLWREVKPEEE